MIKDFKDFIARGNVIDLAVGIIIGAAFGKIVTSIVDDILMPLLGIILGGTNFNTLSITVGDASITYGAFIQSTVDFIIIAACIFILIRFVNKMMPKKQSAKPDDIILLEEIRDLLKNKK